MHMKMNCMGKISVTEIQVDMGLVKMCCEEEETLAVLNATAVAVIVAVVVTEGTESVYGHGTLPAYTSAIDSESDDEDGDEDDPVLREVREHNARVLGRNRG